MSLARAVVLVGASLAACGGQRSGVGEMAAFSSSDLEGCFANGATDPWKPQADAQVHVLATESTDFPSAGIAYSGGQLIGYDRADGRILRWTGSGTPVPGFGRFGRGPGELAPPGATRVFAAPSPVWISAVSDTIAVFDGNDIHLFDPSGGFLSKMPRLGEVIAGVEAFAGRIRRVPGGVMVGVEARLDFDHRHEDRPRPFRLWLIGAESASAQAEIELDPLPRGSRGGYYHGGGEASPIWDLADDCFVVSDGSTPQLVVGRMGRTGLDTIPIPIPVTPREIDREAEADVAKLLAQMGAGGTLPPPSMPRRIAGLVVDPAGWIWLLPVQATGRYLHVIRVALTGSRFERDSVPVFPAVFGPSPGYVGITVRDSSGIRRLLRVAVPPAAR